MQQPLKIGTRGSPLALVQANEVKHLLLKVHPALDEGLIEIVPIKTSGDRIQDRPLMEVGGKGLFTREIEDALLSGTISLAVHSAKDMPTELPGGLMLSTFLERVDPRDVLITKNGQNLDQLPENAVVGTSSLRRRAQILNRRPDLTMIDFRGNVDTRLGKIRSGVCDATLLALAGLQRLKKNIDDFHILSTDNMLPAPAQGIIAIETCTDDAKTRQLLAPLDHMDTRYCASAERALLAALDGSCRTPIAALATIAGDRIELEAAIFSPDGTQCFRANSSDSTNKATELGTKVGRELRKAAGPDFFAQLMAYFG